MELWDLLDKDRNPLNRIHPRGAHPPHTYHTVVSVCTVDRQNRLLITLRAPTKEMYPDYWEFTCGSGVAGEDSLTAAQRELSEETGITVPKEELTLLGTLREPSAFMDCYLYRPDCDGEDVTVTLQEGETVDFKWVTFCEFEAMIQHNRIPPPCAMRYGFVRQKLTNLIGDHAWLQPDGPAVPESIYAFEVESKEESV